MALRQFAVFMNAGSYVIRPKSSAPFLIWRRSIARIVPSWMGSSYCLPVRLSTIVRVAAMAIGLRVLLVAVGRLVAGDPVAPVSPLAEVEQLAALAAERPPLRVHGTCPAQHAHRCVGHSTILYSGRSLPADRGAGCSAPKCPVSVRERVG